MSENQATGLRVLVADDEENVRQALVHVLANVGCQVRTAGGGHEAIEALRRESADVLVTDLVMADGEGLELIQQARREQPALRIVVISGRFAELDGIYTVATLLGGAVALRKPFTPQELLSAVLCEHEVGECEEMRCGAVACRFRPRVFGSSHLADGERHSHAPSTLATKSTFPLIFHTGRP